MTSMSSVGPIAEAWLMDVELMANNRAKRVNGYLKRSDRMLEKEKRAFDTELKKRLNRLDGDMAKVRARGEQLKREKDNRGRHLHIPARRNSDCVDVGTLPVISTNGNLVCMPRDVGGSAPDVRGSSRERSPGRGSPHPGGSGSRKNSVAPGLRETLLKSSIGLITQTGSDVATERPRGRRLLRAHSRSSSLPNMRTATISGDRESPSSSPAPSPLMRRKSRKEAFVSGGSSAATSRESSLGSSVDRRLPVWSRGSSRASSLTRLVYCPITDTLYGETESIEQSSDEGDLYLTLLFSEWEEEEETDEDEVDKYKKAPSVQENKPREQSTNPPHVNAKEQHLPSPFKNDVTDKGHQSEASGSLKGARSFRQLRAHAQKEDGYRRRDVTSEQEFMETTQGPESLAAMFEQLKTCRYLRSPGECIDPAVDVDEIFAKK